MCSSLSFLFQDAIEINLKVLWFLLDTRMSRQKAYRSLINNFLILHCRSVGTALGQHVDEFNTLFIPHVLYGRIYKKPDEHDTSTYDKCPHRSQTHNKDKQKSGRYAKNHRAKGFYGNPIWPVEIRLLYSEFYECGKLKKHPQGVQEIKKLYNLLKAQP